MVERFRCAGCGAALSTPVQRVVMPPPGHRSLLNYKMIPPLLEPHTYALDNFGHRKGDESVFILVPGDVRGTRFVSEHARVGCIFDDDPCPGMACEQCGALVGCQSDQIWAPQRALLHPGTVVLERYDTDETDSFALTADWDDAPPDTRWSSVAPKPVQARPELIATRWRDRDLKSHLFRDDPPA